MSGTQDTISPLHIKEAEHQVVLHPEDDDLFVQTGKQVIEACRLNISLELWQHEVTSMFDRIREWAGERADRLTGCHATPKPAKLVVFVTPSSDTFDFDLADEITALNRELMRNFNVGYIELLQIPAGQIDRFVDPHQSRPLYVKPE